MSYCVMCGSPIPADQGSRSCSMCYGDVDHGKDGYYRNWIERQAEEEAYQRWQDEQNERQEQPNE